MPQNKTNTAEYMNTILAYIVVGIVAAAIAKYGVREDASLPAPEPQEAPQKAKPRKYTTVKSYRRVVAS